MHDWWFRSSVRCRLLPVAMLVLLATAGCRAMPYDPWPQSADPPLFTTGTLDFAPCQLAISKPPEDRATPRDEVVRAYHTSDGVTATLTYGRARGRDDDYGWALIRDRYLYGISLGSLPPTTFPEVGICTEADVLELLGWTMQHSRPRAQAGRQVYTYPIPGRRYEVSAVVDENGAVVAGYPTKY